MSLSFSNTERSITDIEIGAIESKYSIVLPNDYKTHIKRYNGGNPDKNIFLSDEEVEMQVACFYSIKYGTADVEKTLGRYYMGEKESLPRNYFPFAYDPGGNDYCILLDDGSVHIWYHDMGGQSKKLANSFTDFLGRLQDPEEYLF